MIQSWLSNLEKGVKIEALTKEIGLPEKALSTDTRIAKAFSRTMPNNTAFVKFQDPDPLLEFIYPSTIAAKMTLSEYLEVLLLKLDSDHINAIVTILYETLKKKIKA